MKLGIIGAMDVEVENLKPSIKNQKYENISGIDFITGQINGVEIVTAVCGMGKVFAAICTEVMILHFGVDQVVNIGVAGTLVKDLKVLDVVVATSIVQHDMNTTAIGNPIGYFPSIDTIYFESDDELRECACSVLRDKEIYYQTGVIASGDLFVDTEKQRFTIRDRFNAVAADMESGAIAQTCLVNNVPFTNIRTISDADGSAMDFKMFVDKAAERSVSIVLGMIDKIS